MMRPEDTSTGDVPYSTVKEASLVEPVWVIAGCGHRTDAVSAPRPFGGAQRRVGGRGKLGEVSAQLGEVSAQLGEVFVEGPVLARQSAQGGLGGLCGLGQVAWPEPGASLDALGVVSGSRSRCRWSAAVMTRSPIWLEMRAR